MTDNALAPSYGQRVRNALLSGMDYAGRGAALADLYSGGMLSTLAGMVPGNSIENATAARDRALEGVPRDAKALATEPINPLAAIFAGPMARTANRKMLQRAEELAAQNAPREQIWNETGWFQGPDKKWRFEIDDSGLAVKDPSKWARPNKVWNDLEQAWTVEDPSVSGAIAMGARRMVGQDGLLVHPELRAAYPDVDNIMLGPLNSEYSALYQYGPPERILLDQFMSPDAVRKPSAHEFQHAVQNREGFSPGNRIGAGVNSADSYNRAAGEVEARAVERRLDLTPEQRRVRAPWLDYNVPEQDQIVRFR
jgi:hypothetical protein